MLNTLTFNFFVLHRPKRLVTIAGASLLLLLQPEINRRNELPLVVFRFPDYPAFLPF